MMQPMSVQRLPGARFRVVIGEPFTLENTGDRDADVSAGVAPHQRFRRGAECASGRPNGSGFHKRWPRVEYETAQS